MNEQGILGTNLVDNHPHILKMIAAATRNEGVEKELWLITEFHEKVNSLNIILLLIYQMRIK